MEEQSQESLIASLMESNDMLQGELNQLRNNNRILRKVNSAVRSANESLRRQVSLAEENDLMFKQFCAGEFDAQPAAV